MEKSEDLSGEWQIVSSVDETGLEKNEDEKSAVDSSNVTEDEIQASGSAVQDIDQGNAVLHDSSSSDIELIEETEENTTTGVLPSSSLSIISSIEKSSESCSGEISTPSSTSSNIVTPQIEENNEPRTEESDPNEEHTANVNDDSQDSPWIIGGRTIYDWLILILQYIENMTHDQWWNVGATLIIFFSICCTVNIVNIFAHNDRGNVVSQMKEMIEELKNDNKLLRDQLMSEMKNDKMLTSFEHQIRELKKENSKLNHMLFDVVKVLEKQKDSQEKLLGKKESEYLVPFKKEINKLKEHINILKFDNEELQKQLVRMRYASYSQGGKHADESKTHGKDEKEYKSDKTKYSEGDDVKSSETDNTKNSETDNTKNSETDNTKNSETDNAKNSETEIPIHLKDLRKWNELINMLADELGIIESKDFEISYTDSKKKDWGWNTIKRNLKGTFDNLNNINISDLLSKYLKYNEKAMSDIYKSVRNYFSSARENTQQVFDSFNFEDATFEDAKTEIKSNIWDTLKDLSGKWAEMKNKFYSSYLKKGFSSSKRGFEKSGSSEDIHKHSDATKVEKSQEPKKTPDFSKAEKQDRVLNDPEKKAWQFERAEHRAELREGEEEPPINWFLKKGKHEDEKTLEDDSVDKNKWTFEF